MAGLAVCGAALLVPAQQDLAAVEAQQLQMAAHESLSTRRMVAYDRVLQGLLDKDPDLMGRVATSQLNLLPEGDVPVLLDTSSDETVVDQWVRDATRQEIVAPMVERQTLLSRLSSGPYRSLLIASGVFCLFMGIMVTGDRERSPA
ncbi:MAG: hypothetical protein CMJ24_09940 [Phycisphaerae bacterium]|nr:hypothetical protein [Phycisphaerae bacterium]MDG1899797.1 hypothetical protein [Phycisphaerales bacterium]